MDSSQAWFCRDLWVDAAKDGGVRDRNNGKGGPIVWPAPDEGKGDVPVSSEDSSTSSTADPTEHHTETASMQEEKNVPIAVVHDDGPGDTAVAAADDDPVLRRRQQGGQAGAAEAAAIAQQRPDAQHKGGDADNDANAGSDFDAMADDADQALPPLEAPASGGSQWTIPNSDFNPARILVNPRCVTTYAGVSHTQLALDLFGPDKEDDSPEYARSGGKYVLEDWDGAPDSFVCQEQKYVWFSIMYFLIINLTFGALVLRQTGGRKAIKTQRRLTFAISDELGRLAELNSKSSKN